MSATGRPRRRLAALAGFFLAAARAFAGLAFADRALRAAFFERARGFAFAARFALRRLTPSRECRMIGFRLDLPVFFAPGRLRLAIVVPPEAASYYHLGQRTALTPALSPHGEREKSRRKKAGSRRRWNA